MGAGAITGALGTESGLERASMAVLRQAMDQMQAQGQELLSLLPPPPPPVSSHQGAVDHYA